MTQRWLFSLACFAAAGAWPFVVNSVQTALMSPLERAARAAWCGAADPQTLAVLGHCALCWAGSALFLAAGMLVARTHVRAPIQLRRR